MYKRIFAVISLLTFSQATMAERAEIWQCVDKTTLAVNTKCMTKKIVADTADSDFFNELALKKITQDQDAFAIVTHFPKKNLTVVKSLEEKPKVLLAANH
ncbi:MAG: hypothetical protein ACSHW0_01940 [Thalassotalea sp.]